jgi:hypothetical protein
MISKYSDDLYSDLHKDALGYRPSSDDYACWKAMSEADKQARWAYLVDELERSMVLEAQYEAEAIQDFEQKVIGVMQLGAETREQAIDWLMDSSDCNGDWDYFCYTFGLPYGYVKGAA